VSTTSPSAFRAARDRLVADPDLAGGDLRVALTELTDRWLREQFDAALASTGTAPDGLALVALGGYGRSELCPGSDIDLLVAHHRRPAEAALVAQAVWYPVWDTGISLGHSVRSVAEAVAIVAGDVESATSMLDARPIAGDPVVVEQLVSGETAARAKHRTVAWLRADSAARRAKLGDVAYSVEPNLKQGGGGLRDAQIPSWLGVHEPELDEAQRFLLDVRVALHRAAPQAGEVLRLEDQDAVAERLGCADADALMTRVAGAARTVTWVLDERWAELGSERRKRSSIDVDASDPVAVLRAAAMVAGTGTRFDRALLARLAAEVPELPTPWPDAARTAFVELLAAGPPAVDVIESLDHAGVWERYLPEWSGVRSRAQRTTHHRFTVDRHLLETAAIAASLVDRVTRIDLLLMAALLHDLHGDRVEVAREVATRMGFSPDDVDVLATLVRHHLLLPEVATRRDLGDVVTIDAVAQAVGSIEVLGLLVALTEADGRATGPTAWTEGKSGLVRTLAERAAWRLQGDTAEQYGPVFPSVEQMLLLRAGVTTVQGEGHTLTVVAPDRPGLFCRVAGALVLRGLNVVSAAATSSDGMALEEFTVSPAFASASIGEALAIDWPRVVSDVDRAMAGRLAIDARVAERATTYQRRSRTADTEVRVRFDDAVGDATVVEVDAPDAVGLLYRVTRALSELDVDIRLARVETMTDRVVDAFSLTDADGGPLEDQAFRAEIERAVRHAAGG
jgi:[protein-PII] uridylyltransferase